MSEYPVRRDPRVAVVAIVIVAVVTIAAIAIINQPPVSDRPKLVVYTYDSFMQWGDDPDTIDVTVFGPFEERYKVDVDITRLQTDANGIVSRLVAEQSNPVADVVIGLDNILILQEVAKSVLEPYEATNLSLINSSLIDALDPDHYLTPFDFGLVTLIYDIASMNTTTHPQLGNLTFSNLADQDMASAIVTQNPRHSSPGLAFLLSEIAMQEKLVGEDWKQWWIDVNDYINVQPGWSEAINVFFDDPSVSMMVSYGTDPAWSAYNYGIVPGTGIATLNHDNDSYAWMQVEGMGLVKNGPNNTLGRLFIEYCLTPTVQSYIALNQWMFPTNMEVELDISFDYALHPDDVALLNPLLPQSEIAANLTTWLDDWDNIRSG
ncbi:MAG: thiamine ABC transporter substrate-binding protein [Candidatus Thorarchaeota archaeon]|jgi:thiamine transport system substrate-binding protein